jgi:hypothetical protein
VWKKKISLDNVIIRMMMNDDDNNNNNKCNKVGQLD